MTTETIPHELRDELAQPAGATVSLFPLERQYRDLADVVCGTCQGDRWVDVLTANVCPECGGDELTPFVAALDRLQGEVQMHALQLGRRIREIEREAEMLEAHVAEMKARAESRRRRIESAKAWLLLQMQTAGVDKVKDEFLTVYLQRNAASFDVIDEEKVPSAFKMATIRCWLSEVPSDLREKVTHVEVSKTALKEHLADTGEVVAGVGYVTDRQHVRVR